MTVGAPPAIATFRDPAGSLRIEGDVVHRRVKPEVAQAALGFLRSPLAQKWVADGRLISTTESAGGEADEILLEHPRVFFPSYPWEWIPDAWIAAGELTLNLCDALLDQGLILKDATPLNVLFEGTRPIFVDILSIDARDPRSPLWLAYAQFVRTFLLPLAAYRYLGWPLAASLQRRDGYEPGDLYPHLGTARRWRRPLRSLVTLPHLLEKRSKRGAGAAAPASHLRQAPEVATAVLRRNLRRLRAQLGALKPAARGSRWSEYPESADHYTDEDHQQKQGFVREALLRAQPRCALDLGANTGVYSRIAAEAGADVVAWDTDLEASARNWKLAAEKRLPIQPLLADPARPSPATGWRNREWLSLLDRAEGRFDCVMMLGLIHHLLVTDQIPLPEIAGLLRDLTTRWAIVEWVPATDPRFAELVRGRDDLYGHLSEAEFLAAIEPLFRITAQHRLKNGRALFLLEAK
ncbi:MAG: class I SAM-dependent methyltransferase [Acidobacteriaceae bacterium]